MKFSIGEAVQFNEKHKWSGCIGFICEIKKCGDDVRYMVAIPVPPKEEEEGKYPTCYIFSMESKDELEMKSKWMAKNEVQEM